MRRNLSATLLRLGVFVVICAFGAFALVAIYGDLRFQSEKTYNAIFSNVRGLKEGNFVRIAGVEVGQVKGIKILDNATAQVTFGTDDTVVLTDATKAVVRYDDNIGGRFLALEEGAGSTRKLPVGGTIPLDRTSPALDLDALIGGFRPLFRALDPGQVNALSGQLIAAFQGQGPTIGSILAQTATLTNTLADRDDLIGQVVVNLNTLLGSLGDHSEQLGTAVDSLAELIHGLEGRKEDLTNSVAYANAASASISDLLSQSRPAIQSVVHQTDRAAAQVLVDHDYFNDFLKTLPDAYRMVGRQALTGDFFSFYMCDLFLKVNGQGGQPVYIKAAGQDSGRCTPK
ncbi:MCE family protein [Mycolicibacterium stellerae]|uniref:MCE family protein n=1 Tax=Mycolicibacterium stellerae TaxID=2358193 RepID=UPI000F0BAC4B|nr:MCE family protein [Mycolicibacterium stellerae]